ncbi:hypothetical protein GVX81_03015 [[Haemophilus] felis]|uniref:Bacterial Ig domain-containing protein n=1 Tax=[Haemophilus] felis TaxID=123822 RepID=A0A1T0BBD1_9PAST|nr:hypothetical protein [[Haemophilus] felis]NBI40359.1 hypothetical protein [[Haemophilus] felis]OOS07091.1 hypothetical protein B0188_01520 [[Haemophilus] felis]
MKIQFKINTTEKTVAVFDVPTGNQPPLVIEKPDNVANYELFDVEAGLAPEKIFVQRKGKDLYISLSQDDEADIIIKDYYEDHCLAPVIGLTESGGYQAFIPESLATDEFIINLHQDIVAAQVLGGEIHYCAAPFLFTWYPFLNLLGGIAGFAGLATLISGGRSDGGNQTESLPAPILETPNNGALVVNPVPGAKVYEITHLKEGDKRPTKTIVEVDDKGNIVNVTQIAPNGDVFNNPTVDVTVVDGKIVLGPDEIQDGSPVTVVAKDDKGRVSPPATATVGFEDNIETLEVPDTGLLDRNNDGIPDAAHPKVKTDPSSQIEAYIDGKLVSIGKTDPNGNGTVPINLIDDKGQPVDPSRVDIRVSAPGKNPKVVKLSDLIDPALPLETPNNTFVKSPDITATLTGEGKTVQIDAKVDKDATELDVRVDSTPDERSNAPEKTLKLTKDSEGKWTIANPNDFPGAEVDASSTAENPKVNLPVTGNLSNGNVVDAVARNAGGNESTPSNAVKITDNGTEAAPAPTEKSQTPTIAVATVKATDESTPADNDPDLLSFGGTGPANAPFTVYKKAPDGTLTPVASGTIDAQGNYEVNVSDVGKNQLDTGDTFVVKATEPGKLESDESNAGTVPAVPRGDTGHTYDTLPPEAPAVATKPNTDDGSAQVTPQNPRPGDEMTVGFKPQKASETDPDTAPVIVKYSFDGEKWTASTPEDERKGLPETFTGTLNIPEELVEDGSTVSAVVTDIAGNHSPQNRGDVGYDNADSITPTPKVTDIRFIDTSPKADRSGEVLRLTVQKVKEGDTLFLYDDQGNTLDSVKVTADTPKAEGSTDDNPIYLVDFTPPANNPAVKGDKVHLSAQSPNKGQSAKVAQTVPAVRDGHIDDPDAEGATGEDGKPLPAEDTLGDHTEQTKPTPPAILVGATATRARLAITTPRSRYRPTPIL